MDLSPEILGLVLVLLPKSDLKQARLVSKSFEQSAVPYLFNEVFLSTNDADFPVTRLTVKHFSKYIKTLIFSSVLYWRMTWSDYKKEARAQRPGRKPAHLDDHIEMRYHKHYNVMYHKQQQMGDSQSVAHLSFALRSLPNLQRIVITDEGTVAKDRIQGQGSWDIDQNCTVPGCSLSATEHRQYQVYQVRPRSMLAQNSSSNPLNLVLLAMWTTRKSVRDIAMQPQGRSSYFPFLLFRQLANQNTYSIRGYFRPLKRLRLDLQIRNFQSEIHLFATGYLARLLSVAENLEELCLRLNYASSAVTPFQCSLGGCRFPKLKSFVLVTCHSSFDELLEFLRACPKLERLVFSKHTLVSGQWKEAVKQMRACENLKDVLLDDLRGGWETGFPRSYRDYYRRVRDFFSNDGPNPFSGFELDRYDADCAAGVPQTWTWDPWHDESTQLYNELHP